MDTLLVYYAISEESKKKLLDQDIRPLIFPVEIPWRSDGWQLLNDAPAAQLSDCTMMIGNALAADEALLTRAPNLKWIHSPMAGLSTGNGGGVDWRLMEKHGIAITPSKIHEHNISEMIVGMMLALSKDFLFFRAQQQAHSYAAERTTHMLFGKTVLIIGTGNIGAATAAKLHDAFHMRVLGLNTAGRAVEGFDATAPFSALAQWLPQADYVVLACPYTEKTHHLLDGEALAQMKPSAYLINIARGQVVEQDALLHALNTGRIAGAALDVFETEPVPENDPLWDTPNLLMTPHVAGNMEGYADAVVDAFLRNLPAFRAGRPEEMPNYANIKKY
ncbi:MAG: D-2-hydroxyacid dehydrogenase [Clostridia bacterium]|nr:D-2-hydroxyacid dehydrogenase [Clostridia bacterium]